MSRWGSLDSKWSKYFFCVFEVSFQRFGKTLLALDVIVSTWRLQQKSKQLWIWGGLSNRFTTALVQQHEKEVIDPEPGKYPGSLRSFMMGPNWLQQFHDNYEPTKKSVKRCQMVLIMVSNDVCVHHIPSKAMWLTIHGLCFAFCALTCLLLQRPSPEILVWMDLCQNQQDNNSLMVEDASFCEEKKPFARRRKFSATTLTRRNHENNDKDGSRSIENNWDVYIIDEGHIRRWHQDGLSYTKSLSHSADIDELNLQKIASSLAGSPEEARDRRRKPETAGVKPCLAHLFKWQPSFSHMFTFFFKYPQLTHLTSHLQTSKFGVLLAMFVDLYGCIWGLGCHRACKLQ